MNKITIDLTDKEMKNLLMIKGDGVTKEEFVLNIVKEKLNSVLLENGFYYKIEAKELYDINNEKILFTKKEDALFNYLIINSLENENNYVDIESIKKDVWKSNETSIFSIRNVVKSIREKTFDNIIKNKSSHGYRVNLR